MSFNDYLLCSLWHPDPPDFRDYLLATHPDAARVRSLTESFDGRCEESYFLELPAGPKMPTGISHAVHACCLLLEFFRANCDAELQPISRSFVHELTTIMARGEKGSSLPIRAILKCIQKFGAPPETLVNHLRSIDRCPIDSPLCYHFALPRLKYFRIVQHQERDAISQIKQLLRAGIPTVFAMSVPSSTTSDFILDVRCQLDGIIGYSVGVITGFDDRIRMPSFGGFEFRPAIPEGLDSPERSWISYECFRQQLVTDIWTAITPSWCRQLLEDYCV